MKQTPLLARPPIASLRRALTPGILAALAATFAMAQTAPSPGSPASEVITLDPFKVVSETNTGYGAQMSSSSSRLNLRYIDVPQTVNVMTSEFLADAFLFDSRDFTKFVSNISPRTNTHQPETFFIRGLQTTTSYVDGFLAAFTVNRDSGLYDRVEYVKGPASAAIGRGEAGGLVNFIQKKARGTNATLLKATIGTDNFYRFEGDYNTVLNSRHGLSFRLPFYYEDGDGTRGGDRMHTEKMGAGPAFAWRISDRTQLDVATAIFEHTTPGAVGSAHWMHPDLVKLALDLNRWNAAVWTPGPNRPYPRFDNVYTLVPTGKEVKGAEVSAIFTHDFNEFVSLRQGLRYEHYTENLQRYNSPPPLTATSTVPSGIAVQLTYARGYNRDEGIRSQTDLLFKRNIGSSKHNVLLGYDIYDKEGVAQTGTRGGLLQDFYNPSSVPPPNFHPDTYVAVNATTDQSSTGDGYGYYAQYSGSFFNEKILVMGGWRKDHANREARNRRNNTSVSVSDTTSAPRVSVSYKPRDWMTLYFVHSLQEDPPVIANRFGGFQALSGATLRPNDPRLNELIFGQVEAKLKEVGLKANLLRGRVTGSVSYYEMIRNGFVQIQGRTEPGANGLGTVQFSEFFIAQGEKVQGMEIELFGQPTNRLTFMLATAFQNGWKPRSTGEVQHIDTLTDEITFHGKYSFRDGNKNGFEITAGGKYWFGGWPISPSSYIEFSEDQYQIDLGVGYYWRGGRYAVQAKVNNVLDDVIYITENSQWPLRRAFLSFAMRF